MHLALDFGTLFFFTLDVNAPADELRSKPNILPLLADGKRQLTVLDDHFHDLFVAFDYRYTADLRRTYCIRGERNDVIIPLNDIDLLAAQFSNDRLNASSLHADACAHRIDILLT